MNMGLCAQQFCCNCFSDSLSVPNSAIFTRSDFLKKPACAVVCFCCCFVLFCLFPAELRHCVDSFYLVSACLLVTEHAGKFDLGFFFVVKYGGKILKKKKSYWATDAILMLYDPLSLMKLSEECNPGVTSLHLQSKIRMLLQASPNVQSSIYACNFHSCIFKILYHLKNNISSSRGR